MTTRTPSSTNTTFQAAAARRSTPATGSGHASSHGRGRRRAAGSAALGLLAGSFAINMLPHLFHGLAGTSFPTPFGPDSSAVINLAWGATNLALAAAVTYLSRRRLRSTPWWAGVAIGVLGTSASLLLMFA